MRESMWDQIWSQEQAARDGSIVGMGKSDTDLFANPANPHNSPPDVGLSVYPFTPVAGQ